MGDCPPAAPTDQISTATVAMPIRPPEHPQQGGLHPRRLHRKGNRLEDREAGQQVVELVPVLVLKKDDDLDLGMALQAGHQRLQVTGAVPEVRLEVVLGDDDIGDPFLEEGLGLALGIDQFGLETQTPVKWGQIGVAAELHDGQEARRFVLH